MNECGASVGLDVHKDTSAVAVALPGRAEPVYLGEIKNQRKSLLRLVATHPGRTALRLRFAPLVPVVRRWGSAARRRSARPRIDHDVRRWTTPSSCAAAELRPGEIRRCLAQDLVRSAQFAHLTLRRLEPAALLAREPPTNPAVARHSPRKRESACRTRLRSVSEAPPIFDDTERIADHCESCSPWCPGPASPPAPAPPGSTFVDGFIRSCLP